MFPKNQIWQAEISDVFYNLHAKGNFNDEWELKLLSTFWGL